MSSTDTDLVVAGYDATDEGADGLALARILAAHTHSDLLVARVIPDEPDLPGLTRPERMHVRDVVSETHAAILAAVPDGDLEVMPVLDHSVVRGLHEVAREQEAEMLVLGSSHHSIAGRVLLGGTIDRLINGAPCPVAVAPPGFRERTELQPPIIGIAWDGSAPARAAMRHALQLAGRCGLDARVVAIAPSLLDRPGTPPAGLEDGLALARQLAPEGVKVDGLERRGVPSRELVAATESDVGLLVIGSHHRATAARMLLGSVSLVVVRHAHVPVIVVADD